LRVVVSLFFVLANTTRETSERRRDYFLGPGEKREGLCVCGWGVEGRGGEWMGGEAEREK
jgi:hypothetical protein